MFAVSSWWGQKNDGYINDVSKYPGKEILKILFNEQTNIEWNSNVIYLQNFLQWIFLACYSIDDSFSPSPVPVWVSSHPDLAGQPVSTQQQETATKQHNVVFNFSLIISCQFISLYIVLQYKTCLLRCQTIHKHIYKTRFLSSFGQSISYLK